MVSMIAVQFIADCQFEAAAASRRIGKNETVTMHQLSNFRRFEKGDELARGILVLGRLQDRGRLFQWGIAIGRNHEVFAFVLHRRSHRQGKCDNPHIRIAGLNELRCLRNILAENQLLLYLVIEMIMLQCGDRGLTIWRQLRIGHGDFVHRRIQQHRKSAADIDWRTGGSPQDNLTGRVLIYSTLDQPGLGQLFRVGDVGGEEQVIGSAIMDLGVKISR